MINSYEEAVNWIHSRLKFGVKPGLDRMSWLLNRLNHPERKIKTVHIAGTNGKGSTLSYIQHILQEEGYEVGTFTSPYIENFNERISINGQPIKNEDFLKVVNKVKPLVEEIERTELGAPTEFEILTVIAIYYFAHISYPDIVLFEVGLGGRLDSTNVIHPMLSIITNIGHDHMDVLGDTIEKVTKEKAGIIKSGIPVISGISQNEAIHVVEETVADKRTKHYLLDREFKAYNISTREDGESFSFASPFTNHEDLLITMKGHHQVKNATLALMAIEYLKRYYSLIVDDRSIINGLKKTTWIGRFETVIKNPYVIVDGAHNPEGIDSLVKTIENRFKGKYHVRLLFSALEDKQIDEMVDQLSQVAFRITFTSFDFPRAAKAKTLFEASKFTNKHLREDWQQAIEEELSIIKENEVLVITGSLYFISQVRQYLLESYQ